MLLLPHFNQHHDGTCPTAPRVWNQLRTAEPRSATSWTPAQPKQVDQITMRVELRVGEGKNPSKSPGKEVVRR